MMMISSFLTAGRAILGGVALLAASTPPAVLVPSPDAGTVPVTILYTSGSKGYFLPFRVHESRVFRDLTLRPGDRYGGYAALAAYIRKTRKETEEKGGIFLLVDGGNSLVGSSEANFFSGKVSVDFMNRMGYHSITISNLDWALGAETVEKLEKQAEFAFLNANMFLQGKDEHPPYLQPYRLVDAGGLKIGIIGYAQHDLQTWLDPAKVEGLEARLPVPLVKKYVSELRAGGADLVVAVDHTAAGRHRETARQIPGIDVLIDGASEWASVYTLNFNLKEMEQVGSVYVFPEVDSTFAVGRADLVYDRRTRRIASVKGERYFMDLAAVEEDPEIEKFVTKYAEIYFEVVGKQLQEVIGYAAGDFTKDWDENWDTSLGRLVCEATRTFAGTDVGLENLGAIRRFLKKGPVRVKDIQDILPFKNRLVTFAVDGRDVEWMKIWSLRHGTDRHVPWIYLAGAEVERDSDLNPLRVTISGREIDPDREYTFVTNEYLQNAGYHDDGVCRNFRVLDATTTEAVIRYIRGNSPLSPSGREVGSHYEHSVE
ncbi:MAG: bifunctional UDP-sugar hydrolase/5'-nucleotidase [Candidatus Erginobacter occultus]|nr:bifunctional UDP-sugar hydrolase/5'-nucleotidase [Candidatus Erginobacter occultus]